MSKTYSYPHHAYLKKQRVKVLEAAAYQCPCGAKAVLTHHVNHDRSDHRIVNLQALCIKCHRQQHQRDGFQYQSKYSRLFGGTLKSLAQEAGVSIGQMYWRLAKQVGGSPELERLLNSKHE